MENGHKILFYSFYMKQTFCFPGGVVDEWRGYLDNFLLQNLIWFDKYLMYTFYVSLLQVHREFGTWREGTRKCPNFWHKTNPQKTFITTLMKHLFSKRLDFDVNFFKKLLSSYFDEALIYQKVRFWCETILQETLIATLMKHLFSERLCRMEFWGK